MRDMPLSPLEDMRNMPFGIYEDMRRHTELQGYNRFA